MIGVYSIVQLGVASGTSIVTLIEIETPAAAVCEILRCWIDNEDSETSTQWAVSFVLKSVDGTNVTTPTEGKHDQGSAASGLTLRGMATTVGTIVATIQRRGFNILNGFEWVATPEERIWVPAGGTANNGVFGLHLPVAPPASVTISAGVTVAVHG